jgi:hypothetical protein
LGCDKLIQAVQQVSPGSAAAANVPDMNRPDAMLAKIAARFNTFDIEASRGGYTIIDRRTSNPIARLRPIPSTDRFELFYWSNSKGRWTTFGNMGRMKLMLESAHEIVENDPIFRIPRR